MGEWVKLLCVTSDLKIGTNTCRSGDLASNVRVGEKIGSGNRYFNDC
jgi:hypothetical protein